MKKIVFTIFTIVVLIIGAGCGGSKTAETGGTNKEGDNTSVSLQPVKTVVEAPEDGYINYDIYLKNNSEKAVNTVSVSVSYLDDKGDIVDSSYPQIPIRILPGQAAAVDGLVEENTAMDMTLDSYNCYDSNGEYYEEYFEEELTPVDLTSPNTEKISKEEVFKKSEIEDDVVLGEGEDDLSVEKIEYTGESAGFKNFEVTLKNMTDNDINTITVNFILLDSNGNICMATYPQAPNKVKPGQSITIDALTDKECADYVTVDGYSYYEGNSDSGEFIDGYFSTIPKAISIK